MTTIAEIALEEYVKRHSVHGIVCVAFNESGNEVWLVKTEYAEIKYQIVGAVVLRKVRLFCQICNSQSSVSVKFKYFFSG